MTAAWARLPDLASVRADLWDSAAGAPAARAVLEVTAGPGPTARDNLAVHAMAGRVPLDVPRRIVFDAPDALVRPWEYAIVEDTHLGRPERPKLVGHLLRVGGWEQDEPDQQPGHVLALFGPLHELADPGRDLENRQVGDNRPHRWEGFIV